jgi:hypothetical protein
MSKSANRIALFCSHDNTGYLVKYISDLLHLIFIKYYISSLPQTRENVDYTNLRNFKNWSRRSNVELIIFRKAFSQV